ncbi:MAG: efflux RND transporter periplasmic adaptor subunit [Acidobacteriota bacterium]
MAACRSEYPGSSTSGKVSASSTGLPREVHITRVEEVPMEQVVTVTGILAAYDQATLRVKAPGRLHSILVDLGSSVRQGQTVAQVETTDYELRLQQAQAALAQVRARLGLPLDGDNDRVEIQKTGPVRQAKARLEDATQRKDRATSLFEQGLIPRTELEAAEVAYKVANSQYQDAVEEIYNRQAQLAQRRSELALARQQLTDTKIVAPFDGVVQERQTNLGEYLAAGSPVVTVVRINPLRLKAEVPERHARNIRLQQEVRVTVEGNPDVYSGRIARLSPTISDQSRMLLVEAEVINNGSLKAGAFAHVEILIDRSARTVGVPSSAVVTFAGIEKVLLVQEGTAQEKPVATGRRRAGMTEILSGVTVGDNVIVDPGNLQSGQPVRVVQ